MASGMSRRTLRAWYVIDADGKAVGKIATRIATLVMGKHKPTYSPHLDHGDNVVVLNAEKVKFTGRNYTQKLYRWHTGYPGGLKEVTPKFLAEDKGRPEELIERAVRGMLPKNNLRKLREKRLFVFKGDDTGSLEMPGLVMKLNLEDADVKFRL